MYAHTTVSGAANLQKGLISSTILTVNAAMTGTITLSDETATAGTPVVAVITNPTVGSMYEYWDMKKGITINPSVACDVTISTYSGRG